MMAMKSIQAKACLSTATMLRREERWSLAERDKTCPDS